jgi:hypothetical protein
VVFWPKRGRRESSHRRLTNVIYIFNRALYVIYVYVECFFLFLQPLALHLLFYSAEERREYIYIGLTKPDAGPLGQDSARRTVERSSEPSGLRTGLASILGRSTYLARCARSFLHVCYQLTFYVPTGCELCPTALSRTQVQNPVTPKSRSP